jgi:WD40 repeat protein
MSNFEHSYALVIGINNYKNGISPLKTAVSDATEIARILETQHDYNVTLLLDEAATIGQLRQVLETELPNQIQAGDRFLFYFAGHGIALNDEDGPEGYLVPQGARLGNVSTYFPMSEVNKALLQLPCRHFLGILDCCFAGAFRWSSTRKAIPVELVTLHKERFDRFIQDPAWQVVTSAAYDQSAWDAFDLKDDRGEIGVHSPFACALIEALEGKADAFPPAEPGKPAGDGVITASELYLYLRDRVEIVTEARAIRQTPGIYPLKKHDKGEYIFLTPGHTLNLPPAPPLDVSKNPYRGLLPFEEKHSNLFFGRNALTQKLYEFVTSHSLSVVLGASGSGKSSLVKAGIIPKLRQCKNGNPWFILPPFRPGESPFKALNNTLEAVNLPMIATPSEATSSGLLPPAERLANWFKEHPQSHLLLVVDQFEELITLCRNDQEREQFLEGLAGAIATYPNQLHLILTLRSDFEPQFRNTALEKDWQTARFVVPAMTREELRQAIEEPASARVMYFEPHELVEQLIDEVANMPGALPLLSFALSELYLKYLKRQEDGKNRGETVDRAITQADYEELGGVTRSLTQRADQEYEVLVKQDPAYEQTIRNVMLRMVAVGGELARRRVPMTELEYPEPENGRIKTAIKCFEDARLLTSGTDSEDQPYQEPAHDALVRGWQKLLQWKEQYLTNVLLQRELTPAANQWANSSKKRIFQGLLWDDDPRLPLAIKLLCGAAYKDNWLIFLKWLRGDKLCQPQFNDLCLNSNEAKFVTDSFEQKYTKRRNAFSITFGVFISLLGLTIFALNNANTAERRRINSDITTLSLSAKSYLNPQQQPEATIDAIRASLSAKSYLNPEQQLEAMINAIRAGRLVKDNEGRIDSDVRIQAITALQSVSYNLKPGLANFRLRNRLENPVGEVTSKARAVTFSKDGLIATAYGDGTIKLWESDGTLRLSIKAHEKSARSISFSPDGQIFVSSGDDSTVKLWKRDGSLLRILGKHSDKTTVPSVSFNPNGKIIASGGADGNINLWTSEGNLIKTIKQAHLPFVQSVEFSPDGLLLASAGDDGMVKLWTPEGNPIDSLQHGYKVVDVSFSRDGQILASAGEDKTIKLWSRDGRFLRTLTSPNSSTSHLNSVRNVSFNSDGKIASASTDHTVRIWKIDGALLQTLKADSFRVWDVNFSPDGKTLASAGDEGNVKLWSDNQTILQQIHNATGKAADFSPDNQLLAYSQPSGEIKVINLLHPEVQYSLQGNSSSRISEVRFSPNGKTIASSSWDGILGLWNFDGTSKSTQQIGGTLESIRFSPHSQIIAVGTWSGDVRLWSFDGQKIGQKLPSFSTKQPGVTGIDFSPDGKLIAVGTWDSSLSSHGTVVLGRFEKNQIALHKTLMGHGDWVEEVSFNPTGDMLASASRDGTIKIWSSNGSPLRTLRGHTNYVLSLNFHPGTKMRLLASASNDNSVKLWNIDTGNEIATLRGHADKINNSLDYIVRFSPDGKLLATTGNDKTLVLWDFDLDRLMKLACSWSGDYLKTNPNISTNDRKLCQETLKG